MKITMLKVPIVAAMILAAGAASAVQKPPAKKTSLSESELRTLAKATPDLENARVLYSVAMATTNNVDRKQAYLRSVAACLWACNKIDLYKKRVKEKLKDAEAFERELKGACKQCSGTGKREQRCYACSGKGRCLVCKGAGQTRTVKYDNFAFAKNYVSKPCNKCKASGRCQRCGGKGATKEKCLTCSGSGKVFSQTVATRVFRDSCNAIADKMNGVVKQKSTKWVRKTSQKENEATLSGKWDELGYVYFVDGCQYSSGGTCYIYAENSSGGTNYWLEKNVNIKPMVRFQNGRGEVSDAYYVSDKVLLGFPTPEARRSWASAMRSGCQKMLEWINTAKQNKVGHVQKELPDTTFKGGCPYASVVWVDVGARQREYQMKAIRKNIDREEFVKTARQVQFKCAIESSDYTKFTAELSAGCGGEFPFVLFSCRNKTVEEIQASVQELLRRTNPDSFAEAMRFQVERNSMFKEIAANDDVCNRLSLSAKIKEEAQRNVEYVREIYEDFCLLNWDATEWWAPKGGRNCLIMRDTEGNWNYTLWLGENGVAQRRSFYNGIPEDHDFVFDYHLIVFPTKESRSRWYEIMKKSFDQLLEWVELASKKQVPVVTKYIYDANKDNSNRLTASYHLITRGQGQNELLKKTLRTHLDKSEYRLSGCPVSLICYINKIEDDTSYKKFKVRVLLKCGDRYSECIFAASGRYEDIKKKCVHFLCNIDPEALMKAWNDKYGRSDLFK